MRRKYLFRRQNTCRNFIVKRLKKKFQFCLRQHVTAYFFFLFPRSKIIARCVTMVKLLDISERFIEMDWLKKENDVSLLSLLLLFLQTDIIQYEIQCIKMIDVCNRR